MLSVIIPSRDPRYLQRTVDDLLEKAEGEIEVIVVLDGYWPKPPLNNHLKVRVIHGGTMEKNMGMREAINKGMAIAQGKYVMKIDEHCMLDQGYDVKLAHDCESDWVVVPRRYRLLPDKWVNQEDGRRPIDYMFLTNPFERPGDKTNGLRGEIWKERTIENESIEIDDLMTTQGSCYYMMNDYWHKLFPDGLRTDLYGPFTSEAQEIGNMAWFTGGRMVVNKKTWYSHWHKGKNGKGYNFTNKQYEEHQKLTEEGRVYTVKYWLTTQEHERDFVWLMEKFWPVPTWPDDWRELILKAKDYEKVQE